MTETVGIGAQHGTLSTRPRDDFRTCELEPDVRRLNPFQFAHVDDRQCGSGTIFLLKTTHQQRIVALDLLDRRESL